MRRQDLKSNVKVDVYKINWSWNRNTERWLRNITKGKTILNICCGSSYIGNVRADINPELKPDVICDVKNPPFREGAFDVVLCDPPFSYYNKFKWVNNLSKIARNELILSSPFHVPWIKGFKKTLYATIQRGNFFVRLWISYQKKNYSLEAYN